ncbi:organic hydroperoxide resistance protein [Plantactinospora sonchi]|uniref:Organic hydroperoxide resistance protein n=1 Tax=Plantactinospora sonchi TaxID=1544735 RepID=A0ABU7RL19_9ACTN
MQVLYTAHARSTGEGRAGHVASSDGLLDLDLAPPKEMGGPGGATNPEQLFAAGYAACFHSALRGVARQEKVDITEAAIEAAVGIGKLDTVGYGLAVALTVELPGVDRETAQRLVEQAHQVCPYSNATRGNVDVTLQVRGTD